MKKIMYLDMDNVLVDFPSGIAQLDEVTRKEYEGRYDEVEGIFALMKPMEGALEAVATLATKYELYVLSTSPWDNPSAWRDKLEWIQRYFGKDNSSPFYKRLILSHNKHLNVGDYLVDDRLKNGADRFTGEHIHFGTERFPDWATVVDYLMKEEYMREEASFVFRYNKGAEAALIYPENQEALRVLSAFVDRYKWDVTQINAVYFHKEYDKLENRVCYLVQNKNNSTKFSSQMEILRRYLLMPFLYPINTIDQVIKFFNELSETPFQYIANCFPAQLSRAGNVMGMWARDTKVDEIIRWAERGDTLWDYLDKE